MFTETWKSFKVGVWLCQVCIPLPPLSEVLFNGVHEADCLASCQTWEKPSLERGIGAHIYC
jgi:hypothetical protein